MYRNTSQVQMSTIGSSKIAHSLSTPTLGPRTNHTLFLTSMGFFATPDKSKMFHMFVFVAPKIWTTTGKLSLTIRLFEYVLACNASYGRSNIWFAWYCGASWCRRTLSPSLPSCSHPPPPPLLPNPWARVLPWTPQQEGHVCSEGVVKGGRGRGQQFLKVLKSKLWVPIPMLHNLHVG